MLVFVYLLFYALITGFLGEPALAPFYSVQHRGILSHAAPTYHRSWSNNEIACSSLSSPPQTALNCLTPPFLSANLWIVPRIVLSLSQLPAAYLVSRDTLYLHGGKPFLLNRSRSYLLCSEEFKKSWPTKSFSCFFSKCWNIYFLS